MFFLKYIIFALAIISTALFINSIISSIVSGPAVFFQENGQEDTTMKMAGLRFVLILIMGLTWPLVFML